MEIIADTKNGAVTVIIYLYFERIKYSYSPAIVTVYMFRLRAFYGLNIEKIDIDTLSLILLKKRIMMLSNKTFFRLLTLIIIVFALDNIYSQSYNDNLFIYISPKPNSINNSPSNNIIISFDEQLNVGSMYSGSLLQVRGKQGGLISGKIISKGGSIIFMPDNDFHLGDEITVDFSGLARLFGDFSSNNYITFAVANYKINLEHDFKKEIYDEELVEIASYTDNDSLPVDFP
ncbi:MAG: Ig-like domain-containing protein, partial [Nitrososphaeraceae archaeon]|nr:Ig-like domain-containing protein [Nitrososphaeraceae archaeon]